MRGLNWNNRNARENSRAATAAMWEEKRKRAGANKPYAPTLCEEWNVPEIERMSVAEFERLLVGKFGPEYLEPIPYAWQGGEFLPCIEVTSQPQQGQAVRSSLPGPSGLTIAG